MFKFLGLSPFYSEKRVVSASEASRRNFLPYFYRKTCYFGLLNSIFFRIVGGILILCPPIFVSRGNSRLRSPWTHKLYKKIVFLSSQFMLKNSFMLYRFVILVTHNVGKSNCGFLDHLPGSGCLRSFIQQGFKGPKPLLDPLLDFFKMYSLWF